MAFLLRALLKNKLPRKSPDFRMKRAQGWLGLLASLAIICHCTIVNAQQPTRMVPQTREQMQLSFSPVVKKAAPAVVNIYSSRTVKSSLSPLFNDPFFRQFLGRHFAQLPGLERTERSLGSGVIVSADGLIITSHHVIKDSEEVNVVLADRREFDAQILLLDEKSDLALLQINTGAPLPYLTLRDSDTLEVGDLVLAIGNPFGVGQTVTSGIISALARTTSVGISDFQFFIQTDAAINPGNSGGALVNLNGELIGVNTAIYSTSGASNGIGFAIPANMVQSVLASAEAGSKRVVRPWLGVVTQQVTQDIAEAMGLSRPQGVLISEVVSGSPAAQGGLQSGDVVLAINDYAVDSAQSMHFRAAITPIGEWADFTVLRSGRQQVLQVKMMAPPEVPARDLRQLSGAHPLHGVTVANLSPALALELEMETSERGVVVYNAGSSRWLQRGDVLVGINGQAVRDTQQIVGLLAREAVAWDMVLRRDGQQMRIRIQ